MAWTRLRLTLDMIKFEHSIFALPFALTGALLAWRDLALHPASTVMSTPFPLKLIWIIAAMVCARSAAMGFNRIADASIDARNPRTRMRHLPAGLLGRGFAWGFVIAASALFIAAASQLNRLCLELSPLALAILLFYSYTKRFTSFSHVVLGFCLGIAPAAAWIAVRGTFDPRILWLTAAVTCWTAGFDIIYSCQDYEFDCQEALFSIPRRLGIAAALRVAQALHAAMVICLLALVRTLHLGPLALAGVAAIAGLLIYEHRLVKPDDLSKVNAAFFTMNGYVSMLFFVFWAADVLLLKSGI
ncbi:MAG TPA: UbiA-like polyprenyltransferase [Verrucomicrobiae bacterium]|nr:UbiA-like polyprenyltransferase [Verrucomicrobiae bacterium]